MGAGGSKSKKRSGASSKSKLLEPLVFFLDESFGSRVVAGKLRQAGIQVEIHQDHFPAGSKDQVWLPVIGKRNWIVLTKDQKIRYRAPELAAVQSSGVRLFTLTAKDVQGEEMASIFLQAMPAIRRLIARQQAPFIAKVTRSASVVLWVELS